MSERRGVCYACRSGRPEQCPRRTAPVDAVLLRYGAPNISPGEDWRGRTMSTWITLARAEECVPAEHTSDGPSGDPATWCGNVRIGDRLYEIHCGESSGPRTRTLWDYRTTGAVPAAHETGWQAGPSVWAVPAGGAR